MIKRLIKFIAALGSSVLIVPFYFHAALVIWFIEEKVDWELLWEVRPFYKWANWITFGWIK